MSIPDLDQHDYLIEFHRIGGQVKVTAIDPITSTEACLTVPVSTRREDASALAVRKLRYVLAKHSL